MKKLKRSTHLIFKLYIYRPFRRSRTRLRFIGPSSLCEKVTEHFTDLYDQAK